MYIIYYLVVVVDVTTLKMAKKPGKLQKENPAGCTGEGEQNKVRAPRIQSAHIPADLYFCGQPWRYG